MRGIVLGNGPSKIYYNFRDRTEDIAIGCNISGKDYKVDKSVISDTEIVWVLKNYLNLVSVPIIISSIALDKMKELHIDHYYEVEHIFKLKEWYNAAHYATEYLIAKGCDKIDIYGCDSIFEDTIASSTDEHVEKTTELQDKFLTHWREIWRNIFDSNRKVSFNVIQLKV